MNFILHKNVLSTYLSDWLHKIQYLPRSSGQKGFILGQRDVFSAIAFGERDIGILLRMLDERLLVLETRQVITIDNIKNMDFSSDAEAIVLLKAIYVQIRMYLDTVAGVIRFFYGQNGLPLRFNILLRKAGTRHIPPDLSEVLLLASQWFPIFKNTRDELVHKYEDFLLLFYGREDGKVIHHVSLSKRDGTQSFDYGSIRYALGEILKNIQTLIDGLLDVLDKRIRDLYGHEQSEASRTETLVDDCHFLYWAYKYGGYQQRSLKVQETYSDSSVD